MSSREDGNDLPFFSLRLGWNLNVLPHLPGSVLKHVGFVQGKRKIQAGKVHRCLLTAYLRCKGGFCLWT